MAAFSVDQDEGLVKAEPAEAGEVDGIGAVAAALLIIIKGRNRHVQLRHEVGFGGGAGDIVDVEDIYGHRGLRFGAGGAAGAYEDHLLQLPGAS